jgi:RNA-directed DNA polymerase
MPRCFAVVDHCVFHAATVPTYATWESTSPEPSKWCSAGPEQSDLLTDFILQQMSQRAVGLFQWLKFWIAPKSVVRDISRMGIEGDASTCHELIDTTSEPLKPGNRRRAIRDPRSLPKPKPAASLHWIRPNPKILDRAEADRLFSDTLRTCNRNVRDLLADIEQLRRYDLPIWKNEADVATALGLTVKQLRHYCIHRHRETTPHYVTFAIRKRSGGTRLIHAPKRRLKAIQRALNEQLVSKLPVSRFAHGFRNGLSVATNAAPHVGKLVVIKLDIAECFPTIHFGRVRGLLIGYGYSYPVAQTLAVLMTEPPRQPVEINGQLFHVPVGPRVCIQGAPTSPSLCNAVLRSLDHRLAGLARKHGFDFTRYADDLTFSGQDLTKIKLIISIAARIAHEEGLPLNPAKTRVLRSGQRQTVTGVIVNDTLGLSRQERRRLRAALHQQRNSQIPNFKNDQQLQGKLAYLDMLNPAQAEALRSRVSRDEP